MPDEFTRDQRIAYFSMEVALDSAIPTYAGGLGVLAGDTIRAAADMGLPIVTVSLVSRAGYFRQILDDQGHQSEQPEPWDPAEHARRMDARVCIQIEGRPVWIGSWLFVVHDHGGHQPVVLLDTDLPDNADEDRRLTDQLYGGDQAYRLKQELVLGIGGVRMLQALGFRLSAYHMNEGHAAFLTLELLRRSAYPAEAVRAGESPYDVPSVRSRCIFTTHTPVEAGHDRFPYPLVKRVLGDFMEYELIRHYAGEDDLNMTRLALNLSDRVNGVAKRHALTSRRMFPGYSVFAITNGVHPRTWTSRPFAELYDARLPGWGHEPELLVRADCCLSKEAVWAAHTAAKLSLLETIRHRTGLALDPEKPLLGYARRMTAYKRPELLFRDIERLRALARAHPFQLVFAGKAHPRDDAGKVLIEHLHGHLRDLADVIPGVFLPNYDMALAQQLVAGCDVWLNTPLPPMEASGTSGMKAAFNGVPSLSVLDGWWAEGCIEGVTGWAIEDGPDGEPGRESLYAKLGDVILPLYAENRPGFVAVMQGAIAKNASFFNSQRMMRRYAADAYLR